VTLSTFILVLTAAASPARDQAAAFTRASAEKYAETLEEGPAIAGLEQALQADPSYAPALFDLGVLHARSLQLEAAASDFQRYLALEPNSKLASQARTHLARVQLDLEESKTPAGKKKVEARRALGSAEAALAFDRPALAEKLARAALKLEDSPRVHVTLASALLEQRKFDEAIRELTQTAAKAKGDEKAAVEQALSLTRREKDFDTQLQAGLAAVAKNDSQGALGPLDKAAAIFPERTVAAEAAALAACAAAKYALCAERLKTLSTNGDAAVAARAQKRLRELSPLLDPGGAGKLVGEAELQTATGMIQRNDLDGAKSQLDLAIAQLPMDTRYAELFERRALVLEKKGDLEGAAADLGRALAFRPDIDELRKRRAELRFKAGDWTTVVEDTTRVLRTTPTDAVARYLRGTALAALDDHDRAVSDLTEAVKLAPADAPTRLTRFKVYRPGSRDMFLVMTPDDPVAEISKGYAEGFRVVDVAFGQGRWLVLMNRSGSWQSSWRQATFPSEWIQARQKEGLFTKRLAWGNNQWVAVTEGTGSSSQSVWNQQAYPRDWFNERWNAGEAITALAVGGGQWASAAAGKTQYGTWTWAGLANPDEHLAKVRSEGKHIVACVNDGSVWVVYSAIRTNNRFREEKHLRSKYPPLDQVLQAWSEGWEPTMFCNGPEGWMTFFGK
jgi:tetratricopeptide (TPR) repeat protein